MMELADFSVLDSASAHSNFMGMGPPSLGNCLNNFKHVFEHVSTSQCVHDLMPLGPQFLRVKNV